MKKQIYALVDAFGRAHKVSVFIEQFAACCVWVKLMMSNHLDDERLFDHKLIDQTTNIERLKRVLNECVSVNFNSDHWSLSHSEFRNLMNALLELVKTNTISYQDLSEAIEALLETDGKRIGNYSISKELSRLGINLLEEKISSVYCPFVAGYKFAHLLPIESDVFGETPLPADEFYAEVHNLLLDRKFSITCTDPILVPTLLGHGGLRQFQSAIAIPPLGTKVYNKVDIQDIWGRFPEKSLMDEVYQLRHMLAQTSERVVCFVTNGFLFRSAAGEKQFKEDILNKNWLKVVISLPSNLLELTSIPLSIVVFDKTKSSQDVLFVDASSEHFVEKVSRVRNKLINADDILSVFKDLKDSQFSKLCSIKEIETQEYNLSPNRYVISEKDAGLEAFLQNYELAKLSDLVEIIRPQAIKHDENGDCVYIEHNLTSLNPVGQLTGDGKVVKVPSKEASKAEKQRILIGDVLVSCRGAVGKVALIDFAVPDNLLASQAFAILRCKPHVSGITSTALYQYLISEYGQIQLTGLVTGTTAQMLSAKDLSNIVIPKFTPGKLAEFEAVRTSVLEKYAQLIQLESEITQLNMNCLK
ncbi:N-6 DNA methylase [Tolumonas auensis]|uniref:N-6 DNA methylase n=1 Tax=Tolumonas auensis TaxID=43948 RepID=UPI002AA5F9AB|nr:N-6 DNA methylase [Tolumonas auensis]